jgi:hypothetical protein
MLSLAVMPAVACATTYGTGEESPGADGGAGDSAAPDGRADGGADAADGAPPQASCSSPMAAGPFTAASVATSTIGAGPVDWSASDSARVPDQASASVQLATGQLSRVLLLQDFRVDLPAKAVITGISVEITRFALSPGVRDAFIGVGLTNGAQGANRAEGSDWPEPPTARAYGGPLDTWGVPWTQAQVKGSTFGVGIAVRNAVQGSVTGLVDGVRMTVHYCP